jgi:hypothetical protein
MTRMQELLIGILRAFLLASYFLILPLVDEFLPGRDQWPDSNFCVLDRELLDNQHPCATRHATTW